MNSLYRKVKLNIRIWIFTVLVFILSPVNAGKTIPEFDVPFELGLGQSLFEENCGSCHGTWGHGTDQGPPLMHKLYVPSHHGDESFNRAALRGVRAHHWQFGDMPPVPGISKRTLDRIVPYIRWLQRKNEVY